MIDHIVQNDEMGCGVACVANRLDISYDQALELFEYTEYAKTVGYKCKYIVSALRGAGVDVRLRHVRAADRDDLIQGNVDIPTGAIVLLEKSELYPFQHYLLKMDDGWLDPWLNMHDDADVTHAKAGIRKQLPGRPYYVII